MQFFFSETELAAIPQMRFPGCYRNQAYPSQGTEDTHVP